MTRPTDQQLAFLLADCGVRQLWARYCDAVWRMDARAFADCFTADAVWKIVGMRVEGREAIAALFTQSLGPSEKVMLWPGIPVLNLEDGMVSSRTQVTELIKRKSGEALRTLAVYYDRYEEADGVWRFAWHHFDMSYMGPPDLSADYVTSLDYGAPPGFPGSDAPSTARPG